MNELDMPGDGNSDWDKWLHAQEQVEVAIAVMIKVKDDPAVVWERARQRAGLRINERDQLERAIIRRYADA